MKNLTILSLFLSVLAVNLHGYSISGTAVASASNLAGGNSSFLIVDLTGGDTLDTSFFAAGVTLAANTTVGNYFIAAHNPVASLFGTTVPGNASFSIAPGGSGAVTDDYFYIAAFGTNTGASVTLAGGNTFDLLSDASWKIGASNGDTDLYGSGNAFAQLASANGAQYTVAAVPEPSSYALLGGLLALGCVMLRRRA
jgi:hypothetical protein